MKNMKRLNIISRAWSKWYQPFVRYQIKLQLPNNKSGSLIFYTLKAIYECLPKGEKISFNFEKRSRGQWSTQQIYYNDWNCWFFSPIVISTSFSPNFRIFDMRELFVTLNKINWHIFHLECFWINDHVHFSFSNPAT